jgi:hypothetical protein
VLVPIRLFQWIELQIHIFKGKMLNYRVLTSLQFLDLLQFTQPESYGIVIWSMHISFRL